MFYPAVDYLVIILLLAFLMVTLFACIFCLRHEYIRKESEKRKKEDVTTDVRIIRNVNLCHGRNHPQSNVKNAEAI